MKLQDYLRHSVSTLKMTIAQLDQHRNETWSKNDIDRNKLPFVSKEKKAIILDALLNNIQTETIYAIEYENEFYLYNSIQYWVVKQELNNINITFQHKRLLKNIHIDIKLLLLNKDNFQNVIDYLDCLYA